MTRLGITIQGVMWGPGFSLTRMMPRGLRPQQVVFPAHHCPPPYPPAGPVNIRKLCATPVFAWKPSGRSWCVRSHTGQTPTPAFSPSPRHTPSDLLGQTNMTKRIPYPPTLTNRTYHPHPPPASTPPPNLHTVYTLEMGRGLPNSGPSCVGFSAKASTVIAFAS